MIFQALDPVILVHGGAGTISESRFPGAFRGTKQAVRLAYEVLSAGGSALDAVEVAVKSLELDQNFNAGYGSVLTRNYTVEMDASIMDGASLNAGCVSLVKDIFHPISLARRVMDQTPHTFLAGEATRDLALAQGFQILNEGALVTERAREAVDAFLAGNLRDERMSMGTVGAVAIDANGNVAAATSTGGMTGKYTGRVGDTPLLGSGTYADNRVGAVSTTGYGEYIMRFSLAKDILSRMRYLGETASDATDKSLREMVTLTGYTAGAITMSKDGELGINWSSEMMSFAYQKTPAEICYGVTRDHITVPICDAAT